MGRAAAALTLPGARVAEAETLWYDVTRWPSFVEGFKHVVQIDGAWPEAGSRLVWESVPDGRGRVTETVTGHVEREYQQSDVADAKITGSQAVTFRPEDARDGAPGVRMTLTLDYTLRRRGPLTAITDLLFISRAQSDALRRTLVRFARELEAEREL